MSRATECDVCGKLYRPIFRSVSLDVGVASEEEPDTFRTWSDVDLCPECGDKVLAIIKPALQDFEP